MEGKFQESQALVTELKFKVEKLSNENSVLMEQLKITNSNFQEELSANRMCGCEQELGILALRKELEQIAADDMKEKFEASQVLVTELKFRVEELSNQISALKKQLPMANSNWNEYETKLAESRKPSSDQEAVITDQNFGGIHNTTYDERAQVQSLTALLEIERTDNQSAKRKLEQALEAQTREYRRLVANFELKESEQQTKIRQSKYLTAIEQKKHQVQLGELTAKMVNSEEILNSKEAEVKRLKHQISLLGRDSVEISHLRTQIEHYQKDFNVEHQKRRKAENDLDQHKRENNALQIQLMQVTDDIFQQSRKQRLEIASSSQHQEPLQQQQLELESPQGELFRMPQSRNIIRRSNNPEHVARENGRIRRLSTGSSQEIETSPTIVLDVNPHYDERPMSFECPQCQKTYSSITAVQNHRLSCVDKNSTNC